MNVPESVVPNMPFKAAGQILQVRRSRVAGCGVFACKNIPRGVNFGRYAPFSHPISPPPHAGTFYGLEIPVFDQTQLIFVDAMDDSGNISHFTGLINHSFANNVEFRPNGSVQTIRNIKKGQELFINYGVEYWRCACDDLRNVPEMWIYALLTHLRSKKQQKLVDDVINVRIDVPAMWRKLTHEIKLEKMKRKKTNNTSSVKKANNKRRTTSLTSERNRNFKRTCQQKFSRTTFCLSTTCLLERQVICGGLVPVHVSCC